MIYGTSDKKIHHLHILKCGGTSINSFLDTLVPYDRARPPTYKVKDRNKKRQKLDETILKTDRKQYFIQRNQVRFDWLKDGFDHFDVVHDHAPILSAAPKGTYSFTFLRNPVDRIKSLLRDWSRLKPEDYAHKNEKFRNLHDGIANSDEIYSSVKEALNNKAAFNHFSNYQAKMLLQAYSSLYDDVQPGKLSDEQLLDKALYIIDKHLKFCGITEQMDASINVLCDQLGVCPSAKMIRKNVTKAANKSLESDQQLVALLNNVNAVDLKIYNYALERLEKLKRDYDLNSFEKKFATDRTAMLKPNKKGNKIWFDFSDQIIGQNIQRVVEPARIGNKNVFFGHLNQNSILYLPVPVKKSFNLQLEVTNFHSNPFDIEIDDKRSELFTIQKSKKGSICSYAYKAKRPFIKIRFLKWQEQTKAPISLVRYGFSQT